MRYEKNQRQKHRRHLLALMCGFTCDFWMLGQFTQSLANNLQPRHTLEINLLGILCCSMILRMLMLEEQCEYMNEPLSFYRHLYFCLRR